MRHQFVQLHSNYVGPLYVIITPLIVDLIMNDVQYIDTHIQYIYIRSYDPHELRTGTN